jgi:peptidoglycan/LPS O-acetylase OafA/YrhL
MIAGLDGLRGIAVLMVVLYHTHVLSIGWTGVSIFFVLSGFLITDILIRNKSATLGAYLTSFYGRRLLRIFPVYYAFLVFIAAIGPHVRALRHLGLRDCLPWAFTYTYDVYQASWFAHHTVVFSHLWSLSVEEQFYLFWPIVIFVVPNRLLPRLFAALVIAGPLVRIVTMFVWHRLGHGSDNPFWDLYVLPTSHADAFAMGALLCIRPPRLSPRALGVAYAVFFGVCLALQCGYHDGLLPMTLPHAGAWIWGYTVVDALGAGLILLVSRGELWTPLFRWRPLARLGRISYGLYIFHYPLTIVSVPLADRLLPGRGLATHGLSFAVDFGLAFAAATASYRWLERPLLVLKDVWFPKTDSRRRSLPDRIAPSDVDAAPYSVERVP